ncbi:MAG TPA: hypothetical protein PK340_05825 [Bacilli bacterium]|nr:hypothetical protein [Bacilli bacterium]
MKQYQKRKIQLFATMASLSLSLTSFLYLSYAWFTAQRIQEARLMQVSVEEGLTYTMKFFDGNFNTRDISTGTNSGYQSPTSVANPAERMAVIDYESEFDEITSDMIEPSSTNNPLLMIDIYPGIQYSFSIEVTSGLVDTRSITLMLKEFTALGDEDTRDIATNAPISLSSAIDIYATAIDTTTLSSAQVTSAANDFIQELSPVDKFDESSEGGLIYLPLSSSEITPKTDSDLNKVIFIFTIKFSDSSDSYYRWHSYSGGINYYEKSTLGNSNVYQSKSFSINELLVHLQN